MEKRNISLIGIIPKYPKHSQHNIYGKIKMPPVGIVSVLSQISDDPKFKNIYLIDENNYAGPNDFTGMPDHNFLRKQGRADIAMFYGGMSNSVPRMFSLAKQYKKFGAVTIAGGSHVDALPEEALNSGVDIVVHGEGENTAKELLEAIVEKESISLDKEKLNNVRGISFLDNNNHIFTGRRYPIRNLDNLKDPDLTLIKFLKKRWSAIPISKGRGCNYRCEFCVVNEQYGKYKSSSVEKALSQIVKYSDMGYKHFFFTDDNFAQDPGQTIELCNMISKYKDEFNKNIDMMVQVRTEVAEDDKLIKAMKSAGVTTLAIGYESPIDQELKAMRKGVTLEKLINRSRKLSEHFYLHGMFIFGYPTFEDSEHRSKLTLDQKSKQYQKFFRKAKIDTIQVLNAVPLPGSKLREKLEAENRIFPLEMVGWDKYDGLFLCYDPKPEGLNPYDLQNLPRMLMKNKYLGGPINSKINFGNWINWAYNATVGFPIQFSSFYTKRFFQNYAQKKREKKIAADLTETDIFLDPLKIAWRDIKRKWRNLGIKTYGGRLVEKWFKEYKKSDHSDKIR